MKIWHYAFIVFLGGCCYGVLSTFVKFAYAAGFTMADVTGSQYLFGVLIIWLIVLFSKRKKLGLIQVIKLIVAGVPMGLTGVFYYQSLQSLDASLAIIFLFQFIWIGTLIDWIIYRNKPTKGKLLSIVILLFGSILAGGFIGKGVPALSIQGMGWGALSAITFALFIFFSGTVGKEIPPIQKSALFTTGASLVVLLIFPPVFLFNLPVLLGVAPYGLFLSIFGVVLPPLLFSIGMPHVGPGLGTILPASELPVAVIMSAIVLSEYVSLTQWIGVVLILGGILVGNGKLTRSKKMIQERKLIA